MANDPHDHHVHAVPPAEEGEKGDGGKGLAVLFCELDGFKSINDRFGHHTGDAVLVEVAKRLTSIVRDGDTVARLGGDEFVVLADGLDREGARELTARLRDAIIPPIRVGGREQSRALSRARSSALFGRPVSESWLARWASCSSRLLRSSMSSTWVRRKRGPSVVSATTELRSDTHT